MKLVYKYMFEIRFAIFCLAASLTTFSTMAFFGIKIAGNSPVGVLMANPTTSLIIGFAIIFLLISPPRWLDYSNVEN